MAWQTRLQAKFPFGSVHYPSRCNNHNNANHFHHSILFCSFAYLQWSAHAWLFHCVHNVASFLTYFGLRHIEKCCSEISHSLQSHSRRKLSQSLKFSILDVYFILSRLYHHDTYHSLDFKSIILYGNYSVFHVPYLYLISQCFHLAQQNPYGTNY